MNRKIYKAVAKKFGVSVETVKAEIERSIAYASLQPNAPINQIPSTNAVPTADEVIDFAVKSVKNKNF